MPVPLGCDSRSSDATQLHLICLSRLLALRELNDSGSAGRLIPSVGSRAAVPDPMLLRSFKQLASR